MAPQQDRALERRCPGSQGTTPGRAQPWGTGFRAVRGAPPAPRRAQPLGTGVSSPEGPAGSGHCQAQGGASELAAETKELQGGHAGLKPFVLLLGFPGVA